MLECILKGLRLDPAAAADQIADGTLHIIDRNGIPERRVHRDDPHVMQFFLDGVDLDAIRLQTGGIVASLDRDGIRTRLPVGQVMEKQCAFMGEYGLRTAKVQQVHGVRPCVGRNINAVRCLLHAALLSVGVKRGLGNTDFQNLRGFDDPIVLLKKQIKPVVGGHVITSFLLILYPRLARK